MDKAVDLETDLHERLLNVLLLSFCGIVSEETGQKWIEIRTIEVLRIKVQVFSFKLSGHFRLQF